MIKKKQTLLIYIGAGFAILLFVGLVILIGWAIYQDNREEGILMKYGRPATGIVYEITHGRKSKQHVKYFYFVDGVKYEGEQPFFGSYVEVNDKFEVIYLPEKPKISRLNFKKYLYEKKSVDLIDSSMIHGF